MGLLLVTTIGLGGGGGCAEGTDGFVPQVPVDPAAVRSDEPVTDAVIDSARRPERPDAADIEDVSTDRAWLLGQRSRALYDRLRVAGFAR